MFLSVCVTVSLGRRLIPWTIIDIQGDDRTFQALFTELSAGKFDCVQVVDELKRATLSQVLVGGDKDNLMVTSVSQSVFNVCDSFGKYIKFVVQVHEQTASGSSLGLNTVPNAFAIMIAAQRQHQHGDNGVPFTIQVKTNKDKLFNDLVQLMKELGVKWNDPNAYGVPFLKKLCDILWYIDGHHDTIGERASKVPTLFSTFCGYNCPQKHKHRKRTLENLRGSELQSHSLTLHDVLQASWFQKESFKRLKQATEGLMVSLKSYATFLQEKVKYQKLHHEMSQHSSLNDDSSHVQFLPKACKSTQSSLVPLQEVLLSKEAYDPVCLVDFTPGGRRQRYKYIKDLEKGMSVATVLYTHSPGGSILSQHFVWRVPDDFSVEAALSENQKIIDKLKQEFPVYHTRAMRKEFVNTYGRFTNSTKPVVLRSIYRELTGDASSSNTLGETDVDKRLKEALSFEDVDIIVDLRELNEGRRGKYDVFWSKCKEYLQECTAVHERRHGDITFMAKAISTRDLIAQVSQKCPSDCAIPSEKWVNLNFYPRNPRAKSSQHYSGVLEAKRMIQKRLFRKSHPVEHYCAALFRYQREFAVKYRLLTNFVCIDDKHRVKVGEPGFPVAAAERGREVVVSLKDTFAVGDHDFTRFSIIPSVVFHLSIPESFEGSWYTGKVFVGLKDAVFEASSPLRHASELHNLLLTKVGSKSILCIYSDGGPDHRLTYISVQLSLIALFLNFDLDFLIACRTAPNHSWKNPVERLMSIINLGFQSVGLMHSKLSEEFELKIQNCNSLKELRTACGDCSNNVKETLQPVIDLLNDIIRRLQLKGEPFDTYDAAADGEIESFWEILHQVDDTLTMSDTNKKAIKGKHDLLQFISHCCQSSQYSFQVKKMWKAWLLHL